MLKIAFLVFIFWFLIKKSNGECSSTCDQSSCATPVNCLAGLVKDKCDCCFVCGALEGQRCYSKEILDQEGYNVCGHQMDCKVRDDLEVGDKPEAICYCQQNDKICGSDGKTYDNMCDFNQARYYKRNGLQQNSFGPCKYAPKLSTKPKTVQNKTGGLASFTCEASGWPLPVVEWRFIPAYPENSEPILLPNDDPLIAIQSFGGQYETTSWLQILKVASTHSGTYECKVINDQGESTAAAKLIITDYRKQTVKRISREERNRKSH